MIYQKSVTGRKLPLSRSLFQKNQCLRLRLFTFAASKCEPGVGKLKKLPRSRLLGSGWEFSSTQTVLSATPVGMVIAVVVIMPMMPIRMIIICVARIVVPVIRPVVGWNAKSNSHMHSSLGLIRYPGNQTERDQR